MPSVTDYDLIVVDEAHRGYILDKEMSETEMLYRNQDGYISKYRTVIEYFDAVENCTDRNASVATPPENLRKTCFQLFLPGSRH